MEFEIDTADLEQIQDCLDHFPIIGVTTNPSILKKANTEDFFARMKSIRSLIGPARQLHAQVVSQSSDMQIKEAEVIHEKADPDIYIKVPVTWEGIRTISVLKQKEFHVTATAIYDSMQMYAAIEAGADYAAVYVNRICKMGGDPFKLIEDAAHIIERCHYSTKILAASFSNVSQVIESLHAGAHSVTVSPEILKSTYENANIQKAIDDFQADWQEQFRQDGIF